MRIVLFQGVETNGIYNAPRKAWPARFVLHTSALKNSERSYTVSTRWAPTEKGAMAMLANLARTIRT